MPTYSLIHLFSYGVKLRIGCAERFCYGKHSNSETVRCIRWETVAARKVLLRDPNKGDYG